MMRSVLVGAVRRSVAWGSRAGVALACVALLVGSRSAWAFKDSVPDWVRTAAQQTLPQYPAETKAVVLLDETTLTVDKDGHAVEHHRRVVKILRQEGRDDALVVVPFDKDTKLLSLHVWSIGPDGHEYALKDSEIMEYGDPGEGGVLYQDERYKVARAPGRDPGGVVAAEYEQRMPGYMSEDDWIFQQDIPSVSRAFTLEMPLGFTYAAVWAHAKPIAPIDLEHQRLRWEVKDVSGIDLTKVPMHPNELSLAGRMTVHFAGPSVGTPVGGTWQSIGEWYTQLAKDRMAATPEIAAKATELTQGKTDFADKSEAIAEFVQKQIRYFVVERGIGGLQPHAADEIFRNRYGDCKDKATLLSAMLSSVGVHSAIVLVDTRRGIVDPDAPSLMGNHAIAAIEIPAGYNSPRLRSVVTTKTGKRYLIFDPTWEKTAFGQLENNLQGGYGLLTEGSESQVIQFPVLSPELNTIHRTASFQLEADGSLTGMVTDKRFGDLSENRRDLFSKGTAKEQEEYLNRVLQQDFTSFSMSDVKNENVDAFNKELTTSYSVAAQRFGVKTGPLLMVRPRVLGREGLEPDTEARKVPIDLNETMQEQDDYTIKLPAGYAVDEMPDPVKVDLGFAAYESSTQLVGDTLHYKRTYTVREVTLPAEKYGEVQKLARVIGADEQSRAVLKKQ
jgi:hypothetical protein